MVSTGNIIILDDQAISSAQLFNFDVYSEAISKIIQSSDTRTPLVIGIFGNWGSGKTSLMRTVEKKINNLLFTNDLEEPGSFIDKLRDNNNEFSKFILESSPKLKELLDKNIKITKNWFDSIENDFRNELKELYKEDIQKYEQFKDLPLIKIAHALRKANKTDLIEKSPNLKRLIKNYHQYEKIHDIIVRELNQFLINPNTFNKKTIDYLINNNISTNGIPKIKPRTQEDFINFNKFLLKNIYPDEKFSVQESSKTNDVTIKTIWFNAWKYDKEEVLWRALVMRILDELKIPETKIKTKRNLIQNLQSIKSQIERKIRSPQFSLNEVDNFENVLDKILDKSNPLSAYILENADDILKKNVKSYTILKTYDHDFVNQIIRRLNIILTTKDLFNEQRFSEVNVTDELRNEVNRLKDSAGKDVINLNYKLLHQAYWDQNLNQKIEDLQDSLYREVYREESGKLEFNPRIFMSKLLSGSAKLGLSAQNPVNAVNAFKEFSESIQKTKRIEHVEKIQFKEQFQYRFEEIIKTYYIKKNKRAVIFIDDLDRCLPEKALEILETIKTFMDVEGCIFIIGIDRRMISHIIRQKYKEKIKEGEAADEQISGNGEDYLEKIIQLSFQLPPIEDDDLKEYINNLGIIGEEFYKPYLDLIITGIENNPRKIKRFFNLMELQRKLTDSIKQKHKFSRENEAVYDSLMVLWAIICSSHYNFRDAVLKDDSFLKDIIEAVLSEEDKQNIPSEINKVLDGIKDLSDDEKNAVVKLIGYEFIIYIEKNLKITEKPKDEDLKTIIRKVISLGYRETEKKIEEEIHEEETTKGRAAGLEIDEIKLAIKNKLSLKDQDLTILSKGEHQGEELNFSNMDLDGANLKGAHLQGARFVRTKLNHANLEGAKLKGAKLNNAKMWYAKLNGADLEDAILIDAELFNADLSKANFKNADLYNAGMIMTRLNGTDFSGAKLIQVTLRSAFFDEETKMEGADIDSITIDNLHGSNWEMLKNLDDKNKNEISKKYS